MGSGGDGIIIYFFGIKLELEGLGSPRLSHQVRDNKYTTPEVIKITTERASFQEAQGVDNVIYFYERELELELGIGFKTGLECGLGVFRR